jgi:hypothetical protein
MKKCFSIIAFLCFCFTVKAQETLSTGCITDVIQYSTNFNQHTRYTQLDIYFSLGVTGERTWRSKLNSYLNLTYFTPYQKFGSGCPPDPGSNAAYQYNLTVDCHLKNSYGESIILAEDYLFTEGQVASFSIDEFQDHVQENLDLLLPEDFEVGQYKLVFYFEFEDDIGYYDPFEISTSLQTGYFSLGRGVFLDDSFQETPLDLSNPTIFWEDIPRVSGSTDPTHYFLSIGKEEDFEYGLSGDLYADNSIITELVTSGNSYTFDQGVLEPGTSYFARINLQVGDYYFPNVTYFETRPQRVDYKQLSFDVAGAPENPDNVIASGKPIRFNIEVENELGSNLPTLHGTLSTGNSWCDHYRCQFEFQ